MNRHNHDHNPKQQKAQDVFPEGRIHVNGAQDGPVSPTSGGKGGGNKSPPGNGKAPPPGNGAEGGRSLPERVTALETEHKHLATKADLEKGLRATERRLSKEAQENKEELRKEAQENKEELAKKIEECRDETRRMPFRLVVWLAGLVTVVVGALEGIEWLRGMLG